MGAKKSIWVELGVNDVFFLTNRCNYIRQSSSVVERQIHNLQVDSSILSFVFYLKTGKIKNYFQLNL